jgi:aldehyde dehydrogenase (NAD+)
VLPVESLDGTVAAIERYDDTPLALYVFSQDESAAERLLQDTRAGGTCVNDVLSHYLNVHLPFGGLRTSGIGRGHGVHGFRAFSNERAVLRRHAGSSLVQALYPPYTGFKERVVDFFLRYWS